LPALAGRPRSRTAAHPRRRLAQLPLRHGRRRAPLLRDLRRLALPHRALRPRQAHDQRALPRRRRAGLLRGRVLRRPTLGGVVPRRARPRLEAAAMRHWRVGTSGFAYDEWIGSFYPEELPGAQRLAYYAARLPAVEINNNFYRMPKPVVLEGWAEQAGSGLPFALEAPRRIPHTKTGQDTRPDAEHLSLVNITVRK